MNTGSYIGGRWMHPNSSRVLRNLNPADPSDVIGEFPSATATDVAQAVEAARDAAAAGARHPDPSADACCGAPRRSRGDARMRSRAR